MNNLELVTVFDAGHGLLEEAASNRFGHTSVLDDVLEQFAPGEFEDDDDVSRGGDYFVSGDGIGVSERRGRGRRVGRTYNLMIWGCRSIRMYSIPRRTMVPVPVALMTCLEMYFKATSWPVTVCTASREWRVRDEGWPDPRIAYSLLR